MRIESSWYSSFRRECVQRRPLSLITAALVAVLLMGFATVAYAVTPTVIAADGASAFSYQDLQDASAKREGGYAAFTDTEFVGDYDDPHGGYDTTTNRCKVCHAVHRAEGAYYLLRADSQDDACDYCHIGGSAHSSKIVYDFGKYTANGHTIGASSAIPDSTIHQWAEAVTLSSVDASMNTISEDIEVRAYDATKAQMYRFTRHHGHSPTGTGRSGYVKVGPLSLRCMNCHQTHNATEMVWIPNLETTGFLGTVGPNTGSYKLLKAYPSGTTTGSPNSYGYYDASQAVRVPETTLSAGVNYSTELGMEFIVSDTGRTVPNWIAQNFLRDDETTATLNPQGSPASITNLSLSVWCADCHNLNIGFRTGLSNIELGAKAHTERTHPIPYTAGHGGPSQCYTCHRADLPPENVGFDACSQCHYGTGSYWAARVSASNPNFTDSDFPHSGDADSIKLLGSYSVVASAPSTIDESVTITEDNLDAVCLRCHGGIGVNH